MKTITLLSTLMLFLVSCRPEPVECLPKQCAWVSYTETTCFLADGTVSTVLEADTANYQTMSCDDVTWHQHANQIAEQNTVSQMKEEGVSEEAIEDYKRLRPTLLCLE